MLRVAKIFNTFVPFLKVHGENIAINRAEAIDILANLIEANVDSPNNHYYRDFITLWKGVLGGSVVHEHIVYRNEYENPI